MTYTVSGGALNSAQPQPNPPFALRHLQWCSGKLGAGGTLGGLGGSPQRRGPGAEPPPPWSWKLFCFWRSQGRGHFSTHLTECWRKRAVNYFLDFSFVCRPIWGNADATVSAFPHVLIVGGGTAFLQQNIWGNGVPPHSPSTTPLIPMLNR